MTGRYNNRNWTYFGTLDPTAKTIGHYMQEAGYHTCIAGKWQLQSYDPHSYPGSHLRRGKGMKVTEAGFDEYSLFHSWHTEDKGLRFARPTTFENGKLLKELKGSHAEEKKKRRDAEKDLLALKLSTVDAGKHAAVETHQKETLKQLQTSRDNEARLREMLDTSGSVLG